MTRVDAGWMGGAGAPARGAQGPPERPVGVVRAVRLDLGIDAQVADPTGVASETGRQASVNASIASAVHAVATGPRGA